jgi:hypothetical protein
MDDVRGGMVVTGAGVGISGDSADGRVELDGPICAFVSSLISNIPQCSSWIAGEVPSRLVFEHVQLLRSSKPLTAYRLLSTTSIAYRRVTQSTNTACAVLAVYIQPSSPHSMWMAVAVKVDIQGLRAVGLLAGQMKRRPTDFHTILQ